ncbi:hypothetical protein CYMTET_12728 [Cymbomonas tetramitiformis]|uniref:Phospholipase D-like domain-containing protein n=1 Tax=Cymbomonas tetramitiformis TaxID=36881 RepID=A0AAE0GK07_9CHLO|nr:hypothetical protein CYMTET_12728 [Cymbomonas tetramitiformis]
MRQGLPKHRCSPESVRNKPTFARFALARTRLSSPNKPSRRSAKLTVNAAQAPRPSKSKDDKTRKPSLELFKPDIWDLFRKGAENQNDLNLSPSSSKWGNRTVSSRPRPSRRPQASQPRAASPVTKCYPPTLQIGYLETVHALMAELDGLGSGDLTIFSVYVFEEGESSTMLMDCMERAAQRGVVLEISVDGSLVSAFTRLCEGTTTLQGELREMSKRYPEQIFYTHRETPTHAKYMICLRASGEPTAIFGGVNIGDRFASWRDFAVRIEGAGVVGSLIANLSLGSGWLTQWLASSSGSAMSCMLPWREEVTPYSICFITNRPQAQEFWPQMNTFVFRKQMLGSFNVRPGMKSFFEHSRFDSYIVAMAYLDMAGTDLLLGAVRRGASVDLIMPATPNVYHDSNMRAMARFLEEGERASGNVRGYLYPGMLHAKVGVGSSLHGGKRGPLVSMLGSCNLKTRSFDQFAELNAVINERAFSIKLQKELFILREESASVHHSELEYFRLKADIEEWLG